MRLDTEIIEGRLDVIERNLSFLEEYKTLSPDEFTGSYWHVRYLLLNSG